MLKAVEFPTGVANLATSLANMDGNTLSLKINVIYKELRSMVHDSYMLTMIVGEKTSKNCQDKF